MIKAWIKDNWADFNEKLLTSLKLFVDGTLRLDNPGLAAVIVQSLNGKVCSISNLFTFPCSAFHMATNTVANSFPLSLSSFLMLAVQRIEDEDEKKAKAGPQWNVEPPEPKIPKNIFSLYLDIFDVDEEEIARQMTLIDFEVYESIKVIMFISFFTLSHFLFYYYIIALLLI